jgi:hypothetical protein
VKRSGNPLFCNSTAGDFMRDLTIALENRPGALADLGMSWTAPA